jgi:F-type H+-transporting ATPase subunit epsilon
MQWKKGRSCWRQRRDNLKIMNLEILTPEKKLYSGEVYGVQMPGISGSFEVLDRHAPLVSALKAGRVKVLKDKQNHLAYFDIQSGFVEVLNNKVTVLVEGATETK